MKQTDEVKRKQKTDPNKPLVRMAPSEFKQAMSEVMGPVRVRMLTEARTQPKQKIRFACVFIVSNGERRLLSYAPEYGDEEGVRQEEEFAEEIRESGELQAGESLDVQLLEFPLEHAVPVRD